MSPTINAPPDVTIAEFFEQFVPPAVNEMITARPLQGMGDVTFRVRFSVHGIGDWVVSVANASQVAVQRDAATPAHLTVRFDEPGFRRSQLSDARRINVLEMMYGDRARFERLLGVKGALTVDLDDHGEPRQLTIVFNEAQDPSVRITVGYNDFCDILDKAANAPALFLSGRIRVVGDIALLLRVQSLL